LKLKFTLVVLFALITTGASAQWYHISLKKSHPTVRETPEELAIADYSLAKLQPPLPHYQKISPVRFAASDFAIEAQEAAVMKTAQHNMRFRVYNDASYNFSDLAHLYMQQKRYSEAKWYLLQSVNISKQQNDDKHTIANLIDLATIKVIIGEYQLAQQDLDEARDLATVRGLNDYLDTIDLTALYLKQTREPTQKPVMIYADGATDNTRGQ
jgi:hypothetical protein